MERINSKMEINFRSKIKNESFKSFSLKIYIWFDSSANDSNSHIKKLTHFLS